MLYHLYEMNHAAIAPWRSAVNLGRMFWNSPDNLLSYSDAGRTIGELKQHGRGELDHRGRDGSCPELLLRRPDDLTDAVTIDSNDVSRPGPRERVSND